MAGKLYIVPTPVGNLGDMTPRAVEVLKQVDTILAEDTRTSGVLLKHCGIATPMRSHHKFNEHEAVAAVVEQLLGGAVMALISDAGTPGISDPGFLPQKKGRSTRLEELKQQPLTMVFYESPLRLLKTLQQFAEAFGPDRDASVVREISKLHNTTHNGTLGELVEYFTANEPRGEIVIVVAGCPPVETVKVDKYAAFKGKKARV